MSVTVTSKLFFDAFTQTGGGGVAYYPGHVADRILARLDIAIAWNLTEARLQFTAGDKTIEMLNLYDSRRFNTQGFKVGDTITVVDTVSNNGNLTIAAISDDGLIITTVEALVTETADSCSVHGVTPITALDFYYNLLGAGVPETYVSLTDPNNLQRFIVSGLDATEVVTPVNMKVGTKSPSWCTNKFSTPSTFETDEVTIIGLGVTNYIQSFRIQQYIITNPVWLVDQQYNFENGISPYYYNQGSSLRYVAKFDAKFEVSSPEADHTGSITTPNGVGSGFDQGPRGGRPLYSIGAIAYEDVATSTPLDRLDAGKDVKVTITLNSATGTFVNPTTKVVIGFFACTSDETDYQNQSTTLVQSMMFDRAAAVASGAAQQGVNNGTIYRVITNYTVAFVSATEVTLVFTVNMASAVEGYFQGKADGDRYYAILATTQNIAITTTKETDRVVCLAAFDTMDWDKTNTSLFEFTGSGIYAYEYPDGGTIGVGSIEGFAGDPWLVRVPFRVNNQITGELSPTVKNITFQVLAYKTGKDDFILEEKVIDCTGFKKLLGVQQILVDESRGFISYTDDPRNEVTIIRDPSNDTATQAAYIAAYGLVLRYEDWVDATIQPGNRNDGTTPEIAKEIQDLTQRWANYSGVEGWALAFRFMITIEGIDGNDNVYQSDIDLSVIGDESSDWPGGAGALTQDLQYFQYDPSGAGINGGYAGEELNAVEKQVQTLVRATYTGDWTLPVTANGWYGWLTANALNGTIFDRRFASSEIASEDASPWSPTDADPIADISYASGNLRINVYTGVKIVVEGLLDSTMWGQQTENLVIYPRLGAKYTGT